MAFLQLHDLFWEVCAGKNLGLTQEQSLALLMKPEVVRINIADQLTSIPEVWTPSLLLDNFINRKFIKEMEEVDNILSGSDKTNP